ncbi:Glutathione transport system permease protein gsiC [Solibacillus isronensis B3W22]|uniref:Glutathione transport system permease protein gsiC n=1 Tax=Solibacillus isronensis B3W22 TaxID=1224748 RepID=K1KQ62_9BACL|nr:ABC transporter permease [Solibacillus isronensis]AMO85611.1 peptide ABC transporter permease [Solibacillus silvestris]EKB46255.1 Glutathione transport system permease protein gsiC [Solibacillus isronensis B3W22]
MQHLFFESFQKNASKKSYYFAFVLLGLLVHIFTVPLYLVNRSKSTYAEKAMNVKRQIIEDEKVFEWHRQYEVEERTKAQFFNRKVDEQTIIQAAKALAQQKLEREIEKRLEANGVVENSYKNYFSTLLERPNFLLITIIPGILMYALLLITSNPFTRFIFERLLQSVFVIIGVATLVFTILYISPFDPARNLLGVEATPAQVENFNKLYGLDQPYLVQLWHSLSGLFTFDLGTSFAGKEDVTQSILNKFPVTLEIAMFSLLMAIAIAIPVGIVSAVRPNSFIDYVFMLIALIGLSIPSFWQGLIFILTFSLELKWFPATYNPSNWMSLVLPIVVLGTSITASIARMTRSSMLEVIHEDYIITAKAKGLSERKVITKHAIRNAMIPIITVIGLLFGGMLGGAAVTEKVFNISGIGSYIVDKQFIPDIPAILGGVVYIAITISIVNMLIDILYAFFDPRIRSKMKKS